MSATRTPLRPATCVIVLALAVPGAMWWTYFTDYNAAAHALCVLRHARPG